MRQLAAALAVLTAAALGVVVAPATAGPPEKADVCHDGDDGWEVINIAEPAFDAHIDHGDAFPGEPVPGMAGLVFDEGCVPVVLDSDGDGVPDDLDQCPGEDDTLDADGDGIPDGCDLGEVLAVAYTDVVDDGGPYDPAVDLLIAKVVDGPDVNGYPTPGDLVQLGEWPDGFEADSTRRTYVAPTNPMTIDMVVVSSPIASDLSLFFTTTTGEGGQFTRRTGTNGSIVEFFTFLPAGGTAGVDNTLLSDTVLAAAATDPNDLIVDPRVGVLSQEVDVDNRFFDFEWYFDPSAPPPPPPPPPPPR